MFRTIYKTGFYIEDLVKDDSWILKLEREVKYARTAGYKYFAPIFIAPKEKTVITEGVLMFNNDDLKIIGKVLKKIPFKLRKKIFPLGQMENGLFMEPFLFKIEYDNINEFEDEENINEDGIEKSEVQNNKSKVYLS